MQVKALQSDPEIARVAPVLLQLRPQYDEAALIGQIRTQQAEGYRLAYVEDDDGAVIAVAGFVIANKLAWGRHLYVDDLITDSARRSLGAGRLLLDWLKALARAENCVQFHLDSGVHRRDAHRFYFREGLTIASFHFETALAAAHPA